MIRLAGRRYPCRCILPEVVQEAFQSSIPVELCRTARQHFWLFVVGASARFNVFFDIWISPIAIVPPKNVGSEVPEIVYWFGFISWTI